MDLKIKNFTYFLIFVLISILNIQPLDAKIKDSWYSDALTAFDIGEYSKCRNIFHKNFRNTSGSYIREKHVSLIPWFESAVAANDLQDAVDILTHNISVFQSWSNGGNTPYHNIRDLKFEDLSFLTPEKNSVYKRIMETMMYYYWDKENQFAKSPFARLLINNGIFTDSALKSLMGELIYNNAQAILGMRNPLPVDNDVVSLIYQASNYGNENAMRTIANMYESGGTFGTTYCRRVIEKDFKIAFRYWKELADKFNKTGGWFKMGEYYLNGYSVDKDTAKALECFEKAYDLNNESMDLRGAAACKIAEIHKDNKNYSAFFEWAEKAGNEDYVFSWVHLTQAYKEGYGTEVKPDKAYYYANRCYKSTNQSVKEMGCIFLSDCYYAGIGCEKDIDKSISIIQEAADNGDSVSIYITALRSYSNGKYDLARKYFEIIDSSPSNFDKRIVADAYLNIGKMYRFGRGYDTDEKKADDYTIKAVSLGGEDVEKFRESLKAMGFLSPLNDE